MTVPISAYLILSLALLVLGLVGVGVLLGLLCGGIRDAWRHR